MEQPKMILQTGPSLDLSEEHVMLRDAVRAFARRELVPISAKWAKWA
jgi:hypothetical protein